MTLKEKLENIIKLLDSPNAQKILDKAFEDAEKEIKQFEEDIELPNEKLFNPITI